MYTKSSWQLDSYEEQLLAYKFIYGIPPLDIIDIHYYGHISDGFPISDRSLRLKDYYEIVKKSTDKPMLFGEFGPLPKAKTPHRT